MKRYKPSQSIFLGLTVLLLLLFSISSVSAVTTTNLVSYYKLDENAANTTVADAHGTNTGTASTNTANLYDASGLINSDFKFDGTSEYVNLTNINQGTMGVSLWIKGWTSTTDRVIMNKWTGTLENGNWMVWFNAGNLDFFIREAGAWKTVSTTIPNSANRNHIVVRYDGTTQDIIVNDGTPVTDSWSGSIASNTDIVQLAVQENRWFYDGQLDEVAIFSSLSDQDVTDLYNAGAGLAYPFTITEILSTLLSPVNDSTLSDLGTNFSASFNITGPNDYNYTWKNATFKVWEDDVEFNFTSVNLSGNNTIATLFIDNFELNNYKWDVYSCYGNSTFTNCTYSSNGNFTFNVVPFNELSQSYSPVVLEGDTSNFSLNISIISFERLSTVSFMYNGTEYPATFTEYGTNKWYIFRQHQIPLVDTFETVEFYWNVELESGFSQNSTIYNQTISEIAIDDCSSYTNEIFNFTMLDEGTQALINGATGNTSIKVDLYFSYLDNSETVIQFSQDFDEINPARICMNTSAGNSTLRLDSIIEYSSGERFIEFYNIQNFLFNINTTGQDILLYNLLEDDGQEFKITYKDENFNIVPGALIQIQRKYVDEGVFKTIEIPSIGTAGSTIAHLVRNDVLYNLLIYQEGVLLASFNNIIADCQNPTFTECVININSFSTGISPEDYSTDDEFTSIISYDKTTRVVSTNFAILSGMPYLTTLNVTLFDAMGNTSVCSDSLTSSGGSLSCTVPASIGNSSIIVKVYSNGVEKRYAIIRIEQDPEDIYGTNVVFLSITILVLLIGMGITDNPLTLGIILIFGTIILTVLNIVSATGFIGGGATILWLIVAIIIIMIKGSNR